MESDTHIYQDSELLHCWPTVSVISLQDNEQKILISANKEKNLEQMFYCIMPSIQLQNS